MLLVFSPPYFQLIPKGYLCKCQLCEPLKIAARIGVIMSNALGSLQYVFTPLASYVVDTPESAMLAGVGGKTLSLTMASHKTFGDAFQHKPQTVSTTLAQLQALEERVDPWDLEAYVTAAELFRLNSVHQPFWCDLALAEPSKFLTPEPLHHWHKMFWDHDAKWCIRVVGGAEIDFRFSVLHPHTGFCHFKEGISKLKQVTGHEHHDIQCYIIPIIAGAVPKRFLIVVRALTDFRYLSQAPEISNEMCIKIQDALAEFHEHKDAIISAGGRTGKKRNVINNWYIPKLEFMQSVVPTSVIMGLPCNGQRIQQNAPI